MFGIEKDKLVATLQKIRDKICTYSPALNYCDCKYTDEPNLGRKGGEGTGCCEVRLASQIINSMTEEEYQNFLRRVL